MPCGPVMPCGPCGPVMPCGPCGPNTPVGVGPVGPAGPGTGATLTIHVESKCTYKLPSVEFHQRSPSIPTGAPADTVTFEFPPGPISAKLLLILINAERILSPSPAFGPEPVLIYTIDIIEFLLVF